MSDRLKPLALTAGVVRATLRSAWPEMPDSKA